MSENPFASPAEEAAQSEPRPVRWGCFFSAGLSSSVIGLLLIAVTSPVEHARVLRRIVGERLTMFLESIGALAAVGGVVSLAVVAVARAVWIEIDARAKTKK